MGCSYRIAIKGDFGDSLRYRQPVLGFILAVFPATLKLAGISSAVVLLIAIPAGIFGVLKRGVLEM